MSEDFSSHPPTMGELRAEKTGVARSWSPRDVLISLLRDIDSGAIEVQSLVIVGETPDSYFDKLAVPDTDKAIALMYRGLNARLNR